MPISMRMDPFGRERWRDAARPFGVVAQQIAHAEASHRFATMVTKDCYSVCRRRTLRANISETFPAPQNREQGGKEMNHDRWSKTHCLTRSGSDAKGETAHFRCSL